MLTLEIVLYSKKVVYCTMKINGYTIFHICVEVHMGRWYANLKQDNFNEKHYRPVRTWKLDGKQNRQTIWINNEKILYKGNIIFLFKGRKIYNGSFTKHAFAIFRLNAFKTLCLAVNACWANLTIVIISNCLLRFLIQDCIFCWNYEMCSE